MNLFPNFDNLGWAMLILMVATSLNGYTPYMVQAMSAPNHTGEGGLWRKNGNFTLPCVDQTMPVLQKGRREGGREGGRAGVVESKMPHLPHLLSISTPPTTWRPPLPKHVPDICPSKCIDGVPVLNQNWGAFFYFVAFVLFCALILLNLYTGADRGVGGPCEWSYP